MDITIYDGPETAVAVALARLADIIGRDRMIAAEEDVRNGSGRLIGVRYTLTSEGVSALAQEAKAFEASRG